MSQTPHLHEYSDAHDPARTLDGFAPSIITPMHTDRTALARRYREVRAFTETLCDSLTGEDMTVQSMTDCSPTKWHLGHSAWFFEAFVLSRFEQGFAPYDERFAFLFNSYYNALGERQPRPRRGMLTRPSVGEVMGFRAAVDERMVKLIHTVGADGLRESAPLIEIGLQHEQQHQELLVTDALHLLWQNPLKPSYFERESNPLRGAQGPAPISWIGFEAGVARIGHEETPERFAYDNESPRHEVFVHPFEIADRLVTNAEYLAFIEDGGYTRSELWLDEGWSNVNAQGWSAPLYWRRREPGAEWSEYTADGERPIAPDQPVTHICLFEADAYARWAGARLPSEAEWEIACETTGLEENISGEFSDSLRLHPGAARPGVGMRQALGDLWEWTGSQYRPYPGYAPPAGAIGEYNGKFMSSQFTLRGGSCATARSHIRTTYRNFFHPQARWQFAGVRLAKDI